MRTTWTLPSCPGVWTSVQKRTRHIRYHTKILRCSDGHVECRLARRLIPARERPSRINGFELRGADAAIFAIQLPRRAIKASEQARTYIMRWDLIDIGHYDIEFKFTGAVLVHVSAQIVARGNSDREENVKLHEAPSAHHMQCVAS